MGKYEDLPVRPIVVLELHYRSRGTFDAFLACFWRSLTFGFSSSTRSGRTRPRRSRTSTSSTSRSPNPSRPKHHNSFRLSGPCHSTRQAKQISETSETANTSSRSIRKQ